MLSNSNGPFQAIVRNDVVGDSAGCCSIDDQSQRGSINPEREPASIKSEVTPVTGHWSEQGSNGFAFL